MRAIFRGLAVMLACAGPVTVAAQELTALARVDPVESAVSDRWFGKTDLTVALSQGVPFRVFLLDDPARLIVDFREADWSNVARGDLLEKPGRISALRFGAFQPGWSRLVADLAEPMVPAEIGMPVDASSGKARLEITFGVNQDRWLSGLARRGRCGGGTSSVRHHSVRQLAALAL